MAMVATLLEAATRVFVKEGYATEAELEAVEEEGN